MKCKALTYCALCAALLFLASCNGKEAPQFDEAPHGTISIAHLKSLAREISTTIVDDVAIEGYIIANDLYGELYKSIVISDQSGGIELSVDCKRTATTFPIGAHITIHCTSLALGDYGGQLILGAQPTGEYVVDRIAESHFSRYFTIDCSTPGTIQPKRFDIGNPSPQDIGNYVYVENVNFGNQAGDKWCETDPETGEYITTERILYDDEGNTIAIRIESRCSYASEEIPTGRGKIGAIAEYFNGNYLLRIINRNIHF